MSLPPLQLWLLASGKTASTNLAVLRRCIGGVVGLLGFPASQAQSRDGEPWLRRLRGGVFESYLGGSAGTPEPADARGTSALCQVRLGGSSGLSIIVGRLRPDRHGLC